MVNLLPPSAGGSVKLKWPQEVAGVLEVGADSENLVDDILNTDHTVFAEGSLYNLVGGQRSSLPFYLNSTILKNAFNLHLPLCKIRLMIIFNQFENHFNLKDLRVVSKLSGTVLSRCKFCRVKFVTNVSGPNTN